MFTLKIHTIDFPQHLHTTVPFAAINGGDDVKPAELMGVAHLFRQLPMTAPAAVLSTVANISIRTTLVFVVAVPNYIPADDFLIFCGPHLSSFIDILFLRNERMEDRYSVLIWLENQLAADGFYCSFNGKRFKPSESLEYTESDELACIPPPDYTELPSCPVCLDYDAPNDSFPHGYSLMEILERLDPDTSGIQSTLCDHSFQCACVSKWTYLSCQVCQLCQREDEKPACAVCGTFKNLWICLICGFVGCGRYEKGHASGHWSDKKHHFSLELETQQIWDYVGDRYVHRLNQSKIDGKSAILNSRCSSVDEYGSHGYNEEEEGLGGALISSKTEAILDEYNRLLASQLDIQRQHYESLLAEAKSRKESSIVKAVEKAIFSRTHDLQYKLEKYAEEKKVFEDRNQELTKRQELLQVKWREFEERERLSLKLRDEKLMDIKEQIRDLKVYLEAQRKLENTTDSDGIRGGTVLPVESTQLFSDNSRRRKKSHRRRNQVSLHL